MVPLETEFGRKRAIEQSSCNKDLSCVNGFCPSFVTVHGGGLRKPAKLRASEDGPIGQQLADLPAPALPALDKPYGILVTGVGGTGVVTIGALLGMAAHLEGKGCSVLDMTGMAQKGGAVVSHIRLAPKPEDIQAVRIAAGGARLVLGCDLVVAASFDGLAKMERGATSAVINSHETTTGEFTRKPDLQFPAREMVDAVVKAVGKDAAQFVDATRLETALIGDSIATNPFMLGYAWQKGLVPLAEASLLRAIELNAVAVEANMAAFRWGRRAAHDLQAVERAAAPVTPLAMARPDIAQTLEEVVERRIRFLTGYQDAAYARRYKDVVVRVQRAESERAKGMAGLALAVARNYFKLLAYKDEYEVARLYADPAFLAKVRANFDGDYKLLLPPRPAADRGQGRGERRGAQDGVRSLDAGRVPGAGEAEGAARHGARRVRAERGTPDRAPPDRGIRGDRRRSPRRPGARQPRARGRDRRGPRPHPRLRSRQGQERDGGRRPAGRADGAVHERPGRAARRGGITRPPP